MLVWCTAVNKEALFLHQWGDAGGNLQYITFQECIVCFYFDLDYLDDYTHAKSSVLMQRETG